MLKAEVKALRQTGDRLFSAKQPYDSRNQAIADQFYVERADFTRPFDVGEEYAGHLMTGYPSMVRRDLANQIGTMLRPRGKQWFKLSVGDDLRDGEAETDGDVSYDAQRWLDYAGTVQRRAMYDRTAMFTKATKEGDHDFATFGGCAISTELNLAENALLYRCWHLRDMAWLDDSYGKLRQIHRNWSPQLGELDQYKKLDIHPTLRRRMEQDKDGTGTAKIRHIMITSEEYGEKAFRRFPWVSIFIDCENDHLMAEAGSWTRVYTLPRWATVSGSQYPYSPATVIALPDARLLQAMTLTLLDAGERSVNPPMVGVSEALRGDLNLYPGGFTAVDKEYDERLGEVLRPLTNDSRNLGYGIDIADRTTAFIREALYLNTLSLPVSQVEMTAYETGQRVEEYIRNALPLFEPMEAEYNGDLCDISFDTILYAGGFGPVEAIPDDIQGLETFFQFRSPLSEMVDKQKGQLFLEGKQILAEALSAVPEEQQPDIAATMDFGATLRDVLRGIGTPEKWLRSPDEIEAARSQREQGQQSAQLLAHMDQGATIAEKLGNARNAMAQGV